MAQHPSLDYLLIIAKHKSITAAAQELHISQQCLSAYLKNLESIYGQTLFTRKPVLQPTVSGRFLIEAAQKIQDIYTDVDFCLAAIPPRYQRIRIGYSRTRYAQMLSFLPLNEYVALHPNVEFSIIEANSKDLEQMLINNELDLYFGNNNVANPNLEVMELINASFYAAISSQLLSQYFPDPEWYRKNKTGICLSAFSKIPYLAYPASYITSIMDAYAHSCGFSWHKISENSNQMLNLHLCHKNLGFTIFDNSIPSDIPPDILLFPVQEPNISFHFACIRKKQTFFAYQEDIWKFITDHALKNQESR